MRKVSRALSLGLATLGVMLSVTVLATHVVHTADGLLIVWKSRPGWKDAYVDIRDWTPREWNRHRDLVRALQEAGYEDHLPAQHRRSRDTSDGAVQRGSRSRTAEKTGEATSLR